MLQVVEELSLALTRDAVEVDGKCPSSSFSGKGKLHGENIRLPLTSSQTDAYAPAAAQHEQTLAIGRHAQDLFHRFSFGNDHLNRLLPPSGGMSNDVYVQARMDSAACKTACLTAAGLWSALMTN